jgi:serine phosphatase RsbU (regulator of sigma subunit)
VSADEDGQAAARLAILREAGLSAAADEGMERFARLVASMVGVPVALVSLVEADRQVFPGLVGLAEPWATSRQTPLSHSLCQHVTASGRPLVLPDARLDERTRASLAIGDLGVVAYAGMPLTDGHGHTLGSLCAIDQQPRDWSAQELSDLSDLAAACSAELQLRIVSRRAQQAQEQVQVALQRSELLLRAAEDLADTSGLIEVRRRVRDLVTSDLKPSYVGLVLIDGPQFRRIPDPEMANVTETRNPVFPLDSPLPSARAARTGRTVIVGNRDTLETEFGPAAAAEYEAAALQAAACVPLPGTRRTLGTLIVGWTAPHQIDVTERAVLTAIAGYTARAIERAQYLDDRIIVAHQLQHAMLTDLPVVSGLELAAAYHPAAAGDLVGGDWYDAYPQATGSLAITVGDITGHDMHAATIMGQIRSMLRQADVHDDVGPAGAVTAVEQACRQLSLDASGTLIHAHLRAAGAAAWQLTWTNAGHPPPLLRHGDGQTEQLDRHDRLLWPRVASRDRSNQQRILVPGDTLLLYTDGLIERRDHDIDTAMRNVSAMLSAAPAGQPLPDLISQLTGTMVANAADDIVLLAVRIPEPGPL